MRRLILSAASIAALSLLPRASAIVFESTGDVNYNTTAPTGLLANSGWQYLGSWNGFVGTPISANQFITAAHVGGSVGNTFFDAGGTAHTATSVAIMNDLAIWTVTGSFANVAPIYTGSAEGLYPMTVFGSGSGRGGEFLNGSGNHAGWFWGGTSTLRWGTNQFEYYITDPSLGQMLVADFDANGGANEATVAGGDSGGATFIQVNGQWQLAGIVYGVESTFRTNATLGGVFTSVAADNRQGLFTAAGSASSIDPTGDWGQRWVASRISAAPNQNWIYTQVPEPSTYAAGIAVAGIATATWLRRRKTN